MENPIEITENHETPDSLLQVLEGTGMRYEDLPIPFPPYLNYRFYQLNYRFYQNYLKVYTPPPPFDDTSVRRRQATFLIEVFKEAGKIEELYEFFFKKAPYVIGENLHLFTEAYRAQGKYLDIQGVLNLLKERDPISLAENLEPFVDAFEDQGKRLDIEKLYTDWMSERPSLVVVNIKSFYRAFRKQGVNFDVEEVLGYLEKGYLTDSIDYHIDDLIFAFNEEGKIEILFNYLKEKKPLLIARNLSFFVEAYKNQGLHLDIEDLFDYLVRKNDLESIDAGVRHFIEAFGAEGKIKFLFDYFKKENPSAIANNLNLFIKAFKDNGLQLDLEDLFDYLKKNDIRGIFHNVPEFIEAFKAIGKTEILYDYLSKEREWSLIADNLNSFVRAFEYQGAQLDILALFNYLKGNYQLGSVYRNLPSFIYAFKAQGKIDILFDCVKKYNARLVSGNFSSFAWAFEANGKTLDIYNFLAESMETEPDAVSHFIIHSIEKFRTLDIDKQNYFINGLINKGIIQKLDYKDKVFLFNEFFGLGNEAFEEQLLQSFLRAPFFHQYTWLCSIPDEKRKKLMDMVNIPTKDVQMMYYLALLRGDLHLVKTLQDKYQFSPPEEIDKGKLQEEIENVQVKEQNTSQFLARIKGMITELEKPINLSEVLTRFYISEYIYSQLNIITQNESVDKEYLEDDLNVTFLKLNNQIVEMLNDDILRISLLGLSAISAHLHTDEQGIYPNLSISRLSEDGIDQLLRSYRSMYYTYRRLDWGRITDTVMQILSSSSLEERIFFTDLLIHLQHNNGRVFVRSSFLPQPTIGDKPYSETELTDLLNIKSGAKDPSTLLEELRNKGYISESLHEKLKGLLKKLEGFSERVEEQVKRPRLRR